MSSEIRRLQVLHQQSRYSSPWSIWARVEVGIWRLVWCVLFRPTPKHLYRWRNLLLRLFGARLHGVPYVASSAFIRSPRNLVIEDRAAIGPRAELYNLATVTIRERATISQEVYLCGGTHDFSQGHQPLVVGRIEIGPEAFLGARAFVLPGVKIGAGAIVGACAVVTKDVPSHVVVAGNPAKRVGDRPRQRV